MHFTGVQQRDCLTGWRAEEGAAAPGVTPRGRARERRAAPPRAGEEGALPQARATTANGLQARERSAILLRNPLVVIKTSSFSSLGRTVLYPLWFRQRQRSHARPAAALSSVFLPRFPPLPWGSRAPPAGRVRKCRATPGTRAVARVAKRDRQRSQVRGVGIPNPGGHGPAMKERKAYTIPSRCWKAEELCSLRAMRVRRKVFKVGSSS